MNDAQRRWSNWSRWTLLALALLGLAALWTAPAAAEEPPQTQLAAADPWARTVELVLDGQFEPALHTSEALPSGPLTDKVRQWLEEHDQAQDQRRQMDQADYEKYVGYAKERIERKEYTLALQRTLQAADNLADPRAILAEPWVQQLITDSLQEAGRLKQDDKWEKAWEIYYYLGILDEREPRYEKLERETLTRIRLDRMFEKDSKWEEPIRDITWDMAKAAIEFIERFYHEDPAPFKDMAEGGLEHLTLLAESKSAHETFEGLKREEDRQSFISRVGVKLDQVRAAPRLGRVEIIQYFMRALDINRQTVNLPENLVVSELMRGAMAPLDDFTSIIWPAEWGEFDKHTQGDFVGVGISIAKNRVSDEIEVVTPLAFTPAYRAGIQQGDIITAVDGKDLEGLSLNKTVEIITGPRGTDVTLTIRRGDKSFDVVLRREQVVIETVTGTERLKDDPQNWNFWIDREQGVAYVRVVSFARNTVDILKSVLSDLRRDGMKGLILDLRDDPGGLLDSAEQMASMFLPKNSKVHSIRGRNPRDNKSYFTQEDGAFIDFPVTVLINESSASASEIVSGALHDNHRATLVGERTYGKFSVQNLVGISNVPKAALKITTARYYLPSGVSLHHEKGAATWGVDPDVPVRLVSKERAKYLELRRQRDVLGPVKEAPVDPLVDDEGGGDAELEDDGGAIHPPVEVAPGDEDEAGADEAAKEGAAEGDEGAEGPDEADGVEGPKLPPLKQEDKNDRPAADPQLDTALLIMRVTLIGQKYPTLATANPGTETKPRPE